MFLFTYLIAGIIALVIRLYDDAELLDVTAEMLKSENPVDRWGCICGWLFVMAIWPVMVINQIFGIYR